MMATEADESAQADMPDRTPDAAASPADPARGAGEPSGGDGGTAAAAAAEKKTRRPARTASPSQAAPAKGAGKAPKRAVKKAAGNAAAKTVPAPEQPAAAASTKPGAATETASAGRSRPPAAAPRKAKTGKPAQATPAKAAARGEGRRRKSMSDAPTGQGAGPAARSPGAGAIAKRAKPDLPLRQGPEQPAPEKGAGRAGQAAGDPRKNEADAPKPTKEARKRWDPRAPFSAYAKASEKLLVRMRPEKVVTAKDVAARIRKGPQGPKVVAAFDFDGTLVGGFTGAMVLQERMRRKEVTLGEIAETAGVTFRAMARLLEANEVVAHSMAQWAGKTEEEMEELASHLHENKIQDTVFPEMREIVAAHREAGHTIVVATSASRYQVEQTVKSLGIDNLRCTQVEVAEGKLTGKLVGDSLFGAGKVAAIEKFVEENGSSLADTYFYADGDEECGLMEAVGYPNPVNPGRKLADAARAKGWPVLRLQTRGSAKPGHFLRGIAGLMAIMPILQAGLAVGLMTRDKRQAANMIMPTWIQTQLDLAGVKLRVSGRKNLWARRPAVFIFNHRNNFDGSFVAALVRTDYVSIAKKDMAKNPVGKLVAAIMPTVFIDRGSGDPRKAAEALQPVVEAVDKGYSIMLAPEGTRVIGNLDSVGPFKKGAFHMAMAAGIPIVPVVIRNALDVASRDGGAMRPGTVDIAVLPPISVAGWSAQNMTGKVAEVRQLFVDTLQNWPEPDDDELE